MTESEKNIISFMETLQYLYFVKRDMDALYQLLDPHISWIGTGNWEICTCLKDAQEMLLKDKAEHKEGFDILESHYRILTQSNLFCSVSGRIRIRDSNSSPLAMDQDLRLTAILSTENQKMRLCHVHLSVADPVQEQGEVFPKKQRVFQVESLKGIIEKQSKELKKQTRDMTAILSNIPGGIQCCENDEYFTMKSYSDSFAQMFGYTREEISKRFQNRYFMMIHADDRKGVKEAIQSQLLAGNTITCEYRVTRRDGNVLWILDKGQLITEEEGTQVIYSVLEDITAVREVQDKWKQTLERYQIIFDQTADIVFEWEIEHDSLIISSNWIKKFGYELVTDQVSKQKYERNIHPEDLETYQKQRVDLSNRYPYTESEIRLRKWDNSYIWCRIRTAVQHDSDGKILRFIGIITDIDDEKKYSQDLLERAERDALTGVYNRGSVEKQIENFFQSEANENNHVVMIIDVDDFKGINDLHGHLFGDAVLSETAQSIQSLFSNGIAGRIGGDEFIVLIKNVPDQEKAACEAEKINRRLTNIELDQSNGTKISASIGISHYPQDGKTFKELYKKADIALYQAKKQGKGQFSQYSAHSAETYLLSELDVSRSSVNETIDSNSYQAGINSKLVEYIFKMLYKSIEVETAINLILSIVGRYYNVSRAYIFENTSDGKHCSNTFEWCAPGIEPQMKVLQNICYDDVENYASHFDENGIFYCKDVSKLHPRLRAILEPQNIKSMLQCAIYDNGIFWGYVGFDDCRENRYWIQEQINTLSFIAEILSIFLLKDRAKSKLDKTIDMMQTILNHQGLMTYVVDKNYQLIYMNAQTETAVPDARLGKYCYHEFFDNDRRCDFCPINQTNARNTSMEIFNPKLCLWVQVEYYPIRWIDDGDGWVISCHDISRYKNSDLNTFPL